MALKKSESKELEDIRDMAMMLVKKADRLIKESEQSVSTEGSKRIKTPKQPAEIYMAKRRMRRMIKNQQL